MGIHIELNNPNRSYFAGQTVDGRVVVQNAKPDKVKEVEVVLEGTGRVRWTEQESYTVTTTQIVDGETTTRPETRTRTVTYSEEENYVAYRSVLAGDGQNSIILPEGFIIYLFRFVLPNNIPSSFTSHIGQVSYIMKAEIKRALFKFNDRTRLPFTVNGIFDLNQETGASLPQQCSDFKGSNCCACRTGELRFVLSLPTRSGFVPGEAIKFRTEVTNRSNQEVTGVKASLQQTANFYARGRSKSIRKIICDIPGPLVEKGEYDVWEDNLLIPAIPPTRLGGMCRIIDLQYFLHFEMKISGLTTSLSGKLPVMIGTIPLMSTFRDFRSVPQQMPMSGQDRMPQVGPPNAGFNLPGSKIEPMPPYSIEVNIPGKSLNLPGYSDVAPSAPVFRDYPDLPPPSYAEAVGAEGFTWIPDGRQNEDGNGNPVQQGQGHDDPISAPSAPSIDEFVPNYITYNRRTQ